MDLYCVHGIKFRLCGSALLVWSDGQEINITERIAIIELQVKLC